MLVHDLRSITRFAISTNASNGDTRHRIAPVALGRFKVANAVHAGADMDKAFFAAHWGRTAALVVVEKVSPTPDRYPRRPGLPARRPLG